MVLDLRSDSLAEVWTSFWAAWESSTSLWSSFTCPCEDSRESSQDRFLQDAFTSFIQQMIKMFLCSCVQQSCTYGPEICGAA